MMRLVMEAVMVIAIVTMIWFVMKISAQEDDSGEITPTHSDENNDNN